MRWACSEVILPPDDWWILFATLSTDSRLTSDTLGLLGRAIFGAHAAGEVDDTSADVGGDALIHSLFGLVGAGLVACDVDRLRLAPRGSRAAHLSAVL